MNTYQWTNDPFFPLSEESVLPGISRPEMIVMIILHGMITHGDHWRVDTQTLIADAQSIAEELSVEQKEKGPGAGGLPPGKS